MEGIRHAQLLLMNSVPKVVHEALYDAKINNCWKWYQRNVDLHNVTRVPEGVVESSQLSTVCGVGELSNQHGGGVRREGQTETNQETGKD